jgi:hypothetical protein
MLCPRQSFNRLELLLMRADSKKRSIITYFCHYHLLDFVFKLLKRYFIQMLLCCFKKASKRNLFSYFNKQFVHEKFVSIVRWMNMKAWFWELIIYLIIWTMWYNHWWNELFPLLRNGNFAFKTKSPEVWFKL